MDIKGVDRENWITISMVAVPLATCTAMEAEVTGACILANVTDLIYGSDQGVVELKDALITTLKDTKIQLKFDQDR